MIKFYKNRYPDIEELINLYITSGLRRPLKEKERINKLIKNANLIFTVYDDEKLVAIIRCITDFGICCYISDLTVDKNYQKKGIAKKLINLVRNELGDEVSYILLSSPEAMNFYPKMGFEKIENSFIIRRKT